MRSSLRSLRRLADELMDEQQFDYPFVRKNVSTGEVIDDQPKVDVLLNRIYRACSDYNNAVSIRDDKSVNVVGSFPWYLERQANKLITHTCLKTIGFCMLGVLSKAERERALKP